MTALAAHFSGPAKPAIIADVWDNPVGGDAGDGTYILRRMIDRGINNVGFATIWDPVVVTFCHAAGEGAVINLRIGGKVSARTIRVLRITPSSRGQSGRA